MRQSVKPLILRSKSKSLLIVVCPAGSFESPLYLDSKSFQYRKIPWEAEVDYTEYAGDTLDGDCDVNITDGNLDEDDDFLHVDNVADEIIAECVVSYKQDYYSVPYNTIEKADSAQASNLDNKEEEDDYLGYDSYSEYDGEAAGEQFYWPGSIPHANSGNILESFSYEEPQHHTSSINSATSPTKRIKSESPAVSSQAMMALYLFHSTCSSLQCGTES